MEKVNCWYSVRNTGDGSVHVVWFLTEADAQKYEESDSERFSEDTWCMVETFIGSNVYKKAVKNTQFIKEGDFDGPW